MNWETCTYVGKVIFHILISKNQVLQIIMYYTLCKQKATLVHRINLEKSLEYIKYITKGHIHNNAYDIVLNLTLYSLVS